MYTHIQSLYRITLYYIILSYYIIYIYREREIDRYIPYRTAPRRASSSPTLSLRLEPATYTLVKYVRSYMCIYRYTLP